MLKRCVRDRSQSLRLATSAYLFDLLDAFSVKKNISAPFVYKALVFSLIENPSDTTVREFYFNNFRHIFKKNPTIPIGLLIEPLLK